MAEQNCSATVFREVVANYHNIPQLRELPIHEYYFAEELVNARVQVIRWPAGIHFDEAPIFRRDAFEPSHVVICDCDVCMAGTDRKAFFFFLLDGSSDSDDAATNELPDQGEDNRPNKRGFGQDRTNSQVGGSAPTANHNNANQRGRAQANNHWTAHEEIGLANPASNRNKAPGFTDEEPQWFTKLLHVCNLKDTFRVLNPDIKEYTYWIYMCNARAKNVGWRLDYYLVSGRVMSKVKSNEVGSSVMGNDLAPILLDILI